jgi:hypothetical protein
MFKEIEKKLTLEEKINKLYEDKEEDLKLFGNYNISQIYHIKSNDLKNKFKKTL